MEQQRELTPALALRMTQIFSVAFLATVIALMGVAWVITSSANEGQQDLPPLLTYVLLGAGLALILSSGSIKKILLRAALRKARGDTTGKQVFAAYQAGHIVGLAMCESGVICGFVLTFLSRNYNWIAALGLLGMAIIIVNFPRQDHFKDLR